MRPVEGGKDTPGRGNGTKAQGGDPSGSPSTGLSGLGGWGQGPPHRAGGPLPLLWQPLPPDPATTPLCWHSQAKGQASRPSRTGPSPFPQVVPSQAGPLASSSSWGVIWWGGASQGQGSQAEQPPSRKTSIVDWKAMAWRGGGPSESVALAPLLASCPHPCAPPTPHHMEAGRPPLMKEAAAEVRGGCTQDPLLHPLGGKLRRRHSWLAPRGRMGTAARWAGRGA